MTRASIQFCISSAMDSANPPATLSDLQTIVSAFCDSAAEPRESTLRILDDLKSYRGTESLS